MARKYKMPKPEDEHEHKCCRDVVEHGCHVLLVAEGEEGEPYFQYSVGFAYNYDHPEVIIIGQKPELGHSVINHVRDRLRAGERFVPGERYGGFLEGYDVTFIEVDREEYPEHLGWCRWFYDGDDFPALQIVWPDKRGRFPWEEGCHPAVVEWQTLLGEPPL